MKKIFLQAVLIVLVAYCNATPITTVDSDNNSIIQIKILDGERTLSLDQALSISVSIWVSVAQEIQALLADGDNISTDVRVGISLAMDYRFVAMYLVMFFNHHKIDKYSIEILMDYKTCNTIIHGWMLFSIQSNKLLNELRTLSKSKENQKEIPKEQKERIIEMTIKIRQLFKEVVVPLVEHDLASDILIQVSKEVSRVNKMELDSFIVKLKDISAAKTTEEPTAVLKTEKARFVSTWSDLTNTTLSLVQQLQRMNNVMDMQQQLKLCRFDMVIYGMATEELVQRVIVAIRLFVTEPAEPEFINAYTAQLQNVNFEQIEGKIEEALGNISTVIASINDAINEINENDSAEEVQLKVDAIRNIIDSREIHFEFECILGDIFTLLPNLKQVDDKPVLFNGNETYQFSDGDFVRYARSRELFSSNSIVLPTVPLPAENAYILFLALQKYVKQCFDIVDKKIPYDSQIDSHIKGLLKIKSKYFYTDFCYTPLLFEKLSSYRPMISNKVYVNVIRSCAVFSESAMLMTDELIESVEQLSPPDPDQSNVTGAESGVDQLYGNILKQLDNIVRALWKSMDIYKMSDLKHKLHGCRTGLLANMSSLDADFTHGQLGEKFEFVRTIYKVAEIIEANIGQINKLNSDNYHTKWCETQTYKILATMLANELYIISTPIYLISQCWSEYTGEEFLQVAAFGESIENICRTIPIYTGKGKPLVRAFITLKSKESYDEDNEWFFHFEKIFASISQFAPIMTDVYNSIPEPKDVTSIAYQRYTEYTAFSEKQKQMRFTI